MKKYTSVLLTLLLVAALALPAGPALAHSNSYCGHSQIGVYETTTYVDSFNFQGNHWHVYEHRRFDIWKTHSNTWHACPLHY